MRTRTAVLALVACAALLAGCTQENDVADDTTTSTSARTGSAVATEPSSDDEDTGNAETPSEPGSFYDKWSWFTDTYWIVPDEGVYSVLNNPTDPAKFSVVRGQTVFHLTDYFNGYFTGAVTVKLTEQLMPSCQFVLGQVTPEGAVHMTMYDADTGTITNQPYGNMVEVDGEWTMVNTMTGPAPNDGNVSHWAYMVLSEPGDATFGSLPFAEQSIPDFLADCPPGPTITRP